MVALCSTNMIKVLELLCQITEAKVICCFVIIEVETASLVCSLSHHKPIEADGRPPRACFCSGGRV